MQGSLRAFPGCCLIECLTTINVDEINAIKEGGDCVFLHNSGSTWVKPQLIR